MIGRRDVIDADVTRTPSRKDTKTEEFKRSDEPKKEQRIEEKEERAKEEGRERRGEEEKKQEEGREKEREKEREKGSVDQDFLDLPVGKASGKASPLPASSLRKSPNTHSIATSILKTNTPLIEEGASPSKKRSHQRSHSVDFKIPVPSDADVTHVTEVLKESEVDNSAAPSFSSSDSSASSSSLPPTSSSLLPSSSSLLLSSNSPSSSSSSSSSRLPPPHLSSLTRSAYPPHSSSPNLLALSASMDHRHARMMSESTDGRSPSPSPLIPSSSLSLFETGERGGGGGGLGLGGMRSGSVHRVPLSMLLSSAVQSDMTDEAKQVSGERGREGRRV